MYLYTQVSVNWVTSYVDSSRFVSTGHGRSKKLYQYVMITKVRNHDHGESWTVDGAVRTKRQANCVQVDSWSDALSVCGHSVFMQQTDCDTVTVANKRLVKLDYCKLVGTYWLLFVQFLQYILRNVAWFYIRCYRISDTPATNWTGSVL